jgi:hypothetical protein
MGKEPEVPAKDDERARDSSYIGTVAASIVGVVGIAAGVITNQCSLSAQERMSTASQQNETRLQRDAARREVLRSYVAQCVRSADAIEGFADSRIGAAMARAGGATDSEVLSRERADILKAQEALQEAMGPLLTQSILVNAFFQTQVNPRGVISRNLVKPRPPQPPPVGPRALDRAMRQSLEKAGRDLRRDCEASAKSLAAELELGDMAKHSGNSGRP